jgi:hypothetical protein
MRRGREQPGTHEGADMSEGSAAGSNDDYTVYTSGGPQPGALQEDGQAVGAADHAADARNSGGADGRDDEGGDRFDDNTYDPLDGDSDVEPATEDGQTVGAADRDADIDHSS